MTIRATLHRQDVIRRDLLEIIATGVHFRMRYLAICDRVSKAISPTLPQWSRTYLRGYADALLDQLSRQAEFRYQMPDGKWVNARDLEGEQLRIASEGAPQATFWPGTEDVFYVDKALSYLV